VAAVQSAVKWFLCGSFWKLLTHRFQAATPAAFKWHDIPPAQVQPEMSW
jgi:hypothetical protein